ncbi:MAG: hypothetical protein ACJA1A_002659 [Saprospiraceae bacterium]|jgi:hypothetical protein|tara:strand:+ start:572 stop:967 length:396 start_codon:yes stop_codon:yes gene_type:complete
MKVKRNWILKNIHLIVSVSIVLPTAIIYGSPTILQEQLNIHVNTIDLANMLKAIMSLYLGVSLVWILGILRSEYWVRATQLNVLFMLTLATGRCLSMFIEGMPSGGYVFAVIAELILGLFSMHQLRIYNIK